MRTIPRPQVQWEHALSSSNLGRLLLHTDLSIRLVFPRGSTLTEGRSQFVDVEDLMAYLSATLQVPRIALQRGAVRCVGTYSRVDRSGSAIEQSSDPIADLFTDARGTFVVAGKQYSVARIRQPARPAEASSQSSRETADIAGDGFRVQMRTFRDSGIIYWKHGAEIEITGAKFSVAVVSCQYGLEIAPAVGCGTTGSSIDYDADDTYVNSYWWGINAQAPDGLRVACAVRVQGEQFEEFLEAGSKCSNWAGAPPAMPELPPPHTSLNWTVDSQIPGQLSKAAPSIATYGGRLHLVHLGDTSNNIWHSTFDGTAWTDNVKVPGQSSRATPALCAFGGRLHMVYIGNASNSLYHTTYDGASWSASKKIPDQLSKAAPALAATSTELHLVHLGDSSNNLWHSKFDGSTWSDNVKIPGQKSKAPPALCAIGNSVHMVHLGTSANTIWYSRLSGSLWTTNQPILAQESKAAPALATFAASLHMVHLGNSSNTIWHSRLAGDQWTTNEPISGHTSKASPSIAEFDGRLFMVHIGSSSNKLWFSSGT